MEAPGGNNKRAKGDIVTTVTIDNVKENKSIAVLHVADAGDAQLKDQTVVLVKTDKWDSLFKGALAVGAESLPTVTVSDQKGLWVVAKVGENEAGSKGQRGKATKLYSQFQREERDAEAKAKKLAELDSFKDIFGMRPLVEKPVTNENERRVYTPIKDLSKDLDGKDVWVRGRIYLSRPVSSTLLFIVLRNRFSTLQVVARNHQELIKFAKSANTESIVDIYGKVATVSSPVDFASVKDVEVVVEKFFVVSMAIPRLPLEIEAASRPERVIAERNAEFERLDKEIAELQASIDNAPGDEKESKQGELDKLIKERKSLKPYATVHQDTRLDNRVLDLRTPANQAIMRLQAAVCRLFREILTNMDFVEIHTPKMISCASEGGAEVFKCEYFDKWGIPFAYLAQSPQLYKQMVIAADFERVFEIGPVFRREDSNTHRHMTEFVGLDLEMSFKQHYHEVLDVISTLFIQLFEGLETRYATELEIVGTQYPFEPLQYLRPTLRLKWPDAISLVQKELSKPAAETINPKLVEEILEQLGKEGKTNVGDFDDLSTKAERLLGHLVKREHQTDFFILDRFPSSIRPFYTMVDAVDDRYSNSYDIFLRGEEICSGAQRIHHPAFLTERAKAKGVPPESIKDYIESFGFGAEPHAGGGVGLERVVMLYLGLDNIRKASLFPRDPKRLTP